MAVAEHEKLHGERVAIALARAADIVARHEPLQHAIDFARPLPHRLHDLGPRQPARLLGQQLQYVQPLVERRGAIAVVPCRRPASSFGPSHTSQEFAIDFSLHTNRLFVYGYNGTIDGWEEATDRATAAHMSGSTELAVLAVQSAAGRRPRCDLLQSAMTVLVSMSGVSKSFPGVRALHKARLELRAGEVHALMGENGAGKSTLMKILAGIYKADEGEILLDGKPVEIDSPAPRAGARHRHHPSGTEPDARPDRGAEHLHRPRAEEVRRHAARRRQAQRRRGRNLRRHASEARSAHGSVAADHRAPADGRDRQGAVLPLARADHGRADRGAERRRDQRALHDHSPAQGGRRGHRLHLAQDGRAEAHRRPRDGHARRRIYRHRAGRDDAGGKDHRHDGRPHAVGRAAVDPRPLRVRDRARGEGTSAAARRSATSASRCARARSSASPA